jgi:hypothetical protein
MLACAVAHANITVYSKCFYYLQHANTHQNCVHVEPPEDGQVMPETCRGFEFQ